MGVPEFPRSLDGLRHLFGRLGRAGSVVRDDRHVADLHDEVRCERGQQVFLRCMSVERERDAVRAVRVDDARGVRVELARCRVDARVQGDGLAGAVAAGLPALRVEPCQARGVEKTEACIGGRDEEAVVQPHADVPCRCVHVAALEQAAADSADFFSGFGFCHFVFFSLFVRRLLFRAGAQAAGYSPPRMSPASLLLYFAAGSTRRPVHWGTLSIRGRSTGALNTISSMGCLAQRNKGGAEGGGHSRSKVPRRRDRAPKAANVTQAPQTPS
jgi:hypothetical protein